MSTYLISDMTTSSERARITASSETAAMRLYGRTTHDTRFCCAHELTTYVIVGPDGMYRGNVDSSNAVRALLEWVVECRDAGEYGYRIAPVGTSAVAMSDWSEYLTSGEQDGASTHLLNYYDWEIDQYTDAANGERPAFSPDTYMVLA